MEFDSAYDRHKLTMEKWSRLKSCAKQLNVDVIVLNNTENVKYVTSFQTDYGTLFTGLQYAFFFPDAEYSALLPIDYYTNWAMKQCPWLGDVWPAPVNPEKFVELLKLALKNCSISGGTIGYDSSVPHSFVLSMTKQFGDAYSFVSTEVAEKSRVVKTQTERKIIETASTVAEAGMEAALDRVKPGVREIDVASASEYAMRSNGAEGFPFHTVAISGLNAALCEEISTTKLIRNGETVLIDQGCVYQDYVSEFARTVIVGKPTQEQRKAYSCVYNALVTAAKTIRPGVSVGEIDRVARRTLVDSGYKHFQHPHATGHGQGLAGWESPMIITGSKEKLLEGMVIAIEPAVFKESVGGIRLEDVFLVTSAGARSLTSTRFTEELV